MNGNSGRGWLFWVDARVKILALVAAVLLLVFLPLGYSVLFFLAAFFLMAWNRIWFVGYVRKNLWLVAFSFAPFAIRLAFEGGLAGTVAGFPVGFGLLHGAQNTLYLLALFMFANLFVQATAPVDVKNGLAGLGMPKRYAFMFAVALGFKNYIYARAQRAKIAQAARGVKNNAFSLLVPTLNSSFSRSKSLALSLSARGFSAED